MKRVLILLVLVVMLASAVSVSAATYSVCASGCDYTTIQSAIDGAITGSTINVGAGTYTEQLIINKDLTIVGAPGAIISSPSSASRLHFTIPESSQTLDPVVFIFGGTNTAGAISGSGVVTVDFSGFEIDGNNDFAQGIRYYGILARNADVTIVDNNIHDIGTDGTETFGITIYGDSECEIDTNILSGFSRGGIGIMGDSGSNLDPVCDVHDNTVTGPYAPSATPTWASNGIQVGYGAMGEIKNNDVSACGWPGTAWAGTGILVVDTSNVIVNGNYVHDNEQAIGVVDFPECYYGSAWPGIVSDVQVINNNLQSNEWGITIANECTNINVEYNTINNIVNDGIDVYTYNACAPAPNSVNINYNNIENIGADGLWVDDPVTDQVDATLNWWGSYTGPSGSGSGSGEPISGNGAFQEWLCLPYGPAYPTSTGVCDGDLASEICTGEGDVWQSELPVGYQCLGDDGTADQIRVKVVKYIDRVHADSTSAKGVSFPMESSWVTPISPGTGTYSLGPTTYEATTSYMDKLSDYTTHELTSDDVLASTAACEIGKFRLVGYTIGEDETDAAGKTPSTTVPALTDIITDKVIIVWNHLCVDVDGDGYEPPVDCNDNDGLINPGATEICDGVDNDCDGAPDEGCSCVNGDSRNCGTDIGECDYGTQTCVGGQWGLCVGAVWPVDEIYGDTLDNDCDGWIDEYSPMPGTEVGFDFDLNVEPGNRCPEIVPGSGSYHVWTWYNLLETQPTITVPIAIIEDWLAQKKVGRSYAFEGERIEITFSATDQDGVIDDCTQGYMTVECDSDPEVVQCVREVVVVDEGLETEHEVANFLCNYYVGSAEEFQDECWISVSTRGCPQECYDSMPGLFSVYLNPAIGITYSPQDTPFGFEYTEAGDQFIHIVNGQPVYGPMQGDIAYTPYFTVENSAEEEAGVYILLQMYGTDFKAPSTGLEVPMCADPLDVTGNVLTIENMEYTATHLNVETEDWVGLPPVYPTYPGDKWINMDDQPALVFPNEPAANFLGVGDDITMRLRLNIPSPCQGSFTEGGEVMFVATVI